MTIAKNWTYGKMNPSQVLLMHIYVQRATNIPANAVVESFMIVSRRCTERNYKKWCTMEEVSNNLVMQCEYFHKGIL